MTPDNSEITTAAVRDLLLETFGRVRGLVERIMTDLPADAATYRPDPEANTIAWLVWHLTRIQDDHIADVAGVEQAWHANGWYETLALPFDRDSTGFGHSAANVAAVTTSPQQLAAYHADVDALTTRFLQTVEPADLGRVVDAHWDPPVILGVRLVSVASDCLQHAGQASYVRGLAERRG